jgi:hypothetical protein
MAQIVFLDTDVMLDYLENRNQEIRDIVAQLLLLHKKEKITLVTSVFNMAELIDKEFEIHFIGWCLKERMSYDETFSKLRKDEELFKAISEKNEKGIKKRIEDFVSKNRITILSFSETEDYKSLYDLVYRRKLKSQDALVVAAALEWKATYFLSNDANLIDKIADLFHAFKLRDKSAREAFRSNVLEAV